MRMHRTTLLFATCLTAIAVACAPEDDPYKLKRGGSGDDDGASATVDGGGGEDQGPPPGGELPDEQFPPELLEPYTGEAIDYYDNTNLGYRQLRAKIDRVFADTGLGGGTDKFFADKLSLLGGADFVTRFDEARVATPDYLLAIDGIAKEACGRAATNKSGPFAGSDPAAATGAAETALATQLYKSILFREPSADENKAGVALVAKLKPLSPNATSAWAGLCEALVRHPDSLFTLPPSVATATGEAKERLQIIKLANDFAGRPPTDKEFSELVGKTTSEKLDYFFGLPEFAATYFHKMRLRTESTGSAEADEAARLWTYLALNGLPMQDLFVADYTVDGDFKKATRPAEHGKTGILTMPGFIKTKPGLPHYNYAARVASDFLGQLFEVTPDIVASRLPAASTVEPGSTCIKCHGVLTPLEHQRLKWADDGSYRTTDENGKAIDDSDKEMVPDYPYKGVGMEGFAVKAVKKERFIRQMFQSQYAFFMGRPLRYDLDERTVYLAMWRSAFKDNGNLKELIKIAASTPSYLGQ